MRVRVDPTAHPGQRDTDSAEHAARGQGRREKGEPHDEEGDLSSRADRADDGGSTGEPPSGLPGWGDLPTGEALGAGRRRDDHASACHSAMRVKRRCPTTPRRRRLQGPSDALTSTSPQRHLNGVVVLPRDGAVTGVPGWRRPPARPYVIEIERRVVDAVRPSFTGLSGPEALRPLNDHVRRGKALPSQSPGNAVRDPSELERCRPDELFAVGQPTDRAIQLRQVIREGAELAVVGLPGRAGTITVSHVVIIEWNASPMVRGHGRLRSAIYC